ncbi:MAG: hypothetical protein RLZZ540_649 [Bacteroidota bacterium]|jgi:hypothetical protein|uniref:hypothetical protein n=1 Tax=Flavobacterium sp. LC2016-12 TaxID=2783794 RepID=UPI00188B2FAF|nr:hypothetical protein [Flavobacterium sp. LC2016-12]MBF4465002.1 hypothetical protein [Flavobacterium sp. LC2016-12]
MDKIRGKFEVILGFVTLVVSLSAFKDELALVEIELGYSTITLAKYLLYSVYGFSICLYLYTIELVVRETKIGSWKIFNYFLWIAYVLFAFILITPILLLFNIIAFKLYVNYINQNNIKAESFSKISSIITLSIQLVIAIATAITYRKERKIKTQQSIENQEIIELDNANKLFSDGYYSNSILESFKVLETHLYKKLTDKDYRIPRHKINDIIKIAIKENIITQEDIPAINDIRGMRNATAHTDIEHTKQQAEFSLEFVKELIKRNGK